MKILRKFINILVDNDMLSKNPFRKYKIRSEKTSKLTLTQSDITKIENNLPSLTGVEYQVMSAFLFSIYSGLRYSDICRINARTDIKTRNKKKWISMTMKKTNLPVKIPIENMFKGAAMKFIKGKTGKLFNLPNNSETNVILKRVLRRIHITKHISFHCARVTTATILLYKNVNITVIQHILGHSSIKTTEIYAKCEDKTINKNIKAAFKK
jgi:site-specific recombinase XerD